MKAKDLAKLLLENPDFEVEFTIFEADGSEYGVGCRTFKINGIGDIGYSSNIIALDGKED